MNYFTAEKAYEFFKALKKFDINKQIALSWMVRKQKLSFRTPAMLDYNIREGKFVSAWAESVIDMIAKSDPKSAEVLRKKFL